ncbi:MAG: O-acetyl-ADP-ribose deacetylase [Thermoguttaceae bacterium]
MSVPLILMEVQIRGQTIELYQGDITLQEVDAVVNAANSRLAGGGGVDGAVHRRGGPAIMADTNARYPQGCPTGSAVVSTAGNLNARAVIHAVGPVWRGGQHGEADLLRSAYRRCFELAVEHGYRSIALPALSTGAYGYPMDQAAQIAVATAVDFLTECGEPQLIRFVLFDDAAFDTFAKALERYCAE